MNYYQMSQNAQMPNVYGGQSQGKISNFGSQQGNHIAPNNVSLSKQFQQQNIQNLQQQQNMFQMMENKNSRGF